MSDQPNIRVKLADLLFVNNFSSHEETRYYLCGVSIEPRKGGGVWLVATDGHTLCYVEALGVADGHVILSSEAIHRLAKGVRKRDAISALVEIDAHTASLRAADGTELNNIERNLALIDGTFPDWPAVVEGFRTERAERDACVDPFTLRSETLQQFANAGKTAARLLLNRREPANVSVSPCRVKGAAMALSMPDVPRAKFLTMPKEDWS